VTAGKAISIIALVVLVVIIVVYVASYTLEPAS
jgi:hypothetical protein